MMVNLGKASGHLFRGERREGEGDGRYNLSQIKCGITKSGFRSVVNVIGVLPGSLGWYDRDAIQEAKIRLLCNLWSE